MSSDMVKVENGHSRKEEEALREKEPMLEGPEFERILRETPITEETTCGFWFLQGPIFQKLASKKSYVILYSFASCMYIASFTYFSGTLTTLEKRFNIPSRNSGIISAGSDISAAILAAGLSYYAAKGRRPFWIAFGAYAMAVHCIIMSLPHILYGPGELALSLTKKYGNNTATADELRLESEKLLCRINGEGAACVARNGEWMPQVIFFMAQVVLGIGGCVFNTLGTAYMDDNIRKTKTPVLISLSYFLRMIGPAGGLGAASLFLKFYIVPDATPLIDNKDPRWIGAWHMGWWLFAGIMIVFGFCLSLFPESLPRAAARRMLTRGTSKIDDKPASIADMKATFRRLITNPILGCNNISSVLYFCGFVPYWLFMPKYLESQYKVSASMASVTVGMIALVCSALGILISGAVIAKTQPKARSLAAWNVLVGCLTVTGMITYTFLGCAANEHSVVLNDRPMDSSALSDAGLLNQTTCNAGCHCDFVPYSPICGSDGRTFISACHAGCQRQELNDTGKFFADCACIAPDPVPANLPPVGGTATDGACKVDCFGQFVAFLAVMSFVNFVGATGRTSNFLVAMRCVEERDKTVAMGLTMMLMCLFAFLPAPIFFGNLFDQMCLVWGKTCTGKGNCWLYDNEGLKIYLNLIAAVFATLGTVFDGGVWYFAKNLVIFDEKSKGGLLATATMG